ncbi:ribosome recycling factor family protein [Shewanella gelidimarina]|uniref:ribosome recycling factor family protein n=1 Tax=Shewanella gelidimarina TaxID=56813 RepID=UPI002010335F|nr:ribosome recycling factor family protein [Shewanella gelidimarina]MCL1060226.1 ribosome recycling factor family protein [Shewanella gelidimarina]
MNEAITISLPSLIHRIGRDAVNRAKVVASQYRCELKRVRRSRNWGLSGEAINIQSFAGQLKAESLTALELKTIDERGFRYLVQKIETALLDHADKLEPLTVKLIRLINENPNITLAELIHVTDCTMSEARTARFDADSW